MKNHPVSRRPNTALLYGNFSPLWANRNERYPPLAGTDLRQSVSILPEMAGEVPAIRAGRLAGIRAGSMTVVMEMRDLSKSLAQNVDGILDMALLKKFDTVTVCAKRVGRESNQDHAF